jgi:hypothetical protein
VPERPPVLPAMFDDGIQPRQHRRVRQVAREQYRQQRAKDTAAAEHGRETRKGAALRILAAYQNRFEHAGTLYEVLVFAREQLGDETFRDISQLRPRVNDLLHLGLVEPLAVRGCRITKALAHPWRVRQVGSPEARL